MKILVVGASGLLGRALVPLLVAAGHSVRAVSRRPLHPTAGMESCAADLLTSDLGPLVEDCTAVVHAATAIPSQPRLPGAWTLNTQLRTLGTRRLVEAAETAGVQRYVQQSITMAYADGGQAWLDETAPFDASPARAAIVAPVQAMEALVRASSLDWCILRGGQFSGPGTAQDALLDALASSRVTVAGDGAYFLSPIHPADMASAVAAALAPSVPPRSIFNVVADPLTYADYVDHLATLCRVPRPRRDPSIPCPPSHRCTAAAAHAHLAWQPTHSIWPETR